MKEKGIWFKKPIRADYGSDFKEIRKREKGNEVSNNG